MDPLVNQAAKLRYMLGGQVKIPLVVYTFGGGGYAGLNTARVLHPVLASART